MLPFFGRESVLEEEKGGSYVFEFCWWCEDEGKVRDAKGVRVVGKNDTCLGIAYPGWLVGWLEVF